jgi:hypothetical protein
MDVMDEAETLARQELHVAACSKFEEAALLEERAAELVPGDKFLRREVVSLWQRAGRPDRVVDLAEHYMESLQLPFLWFLGLEAPGPMLLDLKCSQSEAGENMPTKNARVDWDEAISMLADHIDRHRSWYTLEAYVYDVSELGDEDES